MKVNFGNTQEMERIQYWFKYANELCKNHYACAECPLAGYEPIETDISILRCETGKDKPKGKQDDARTGSKDNRTD